MHKTKMAVSLYLRSLVCSFTYNAMRKYLNFSHPNNIKNYFRTIDSPGELFECENAINSIFSKLIDKQKYCKTFIDERHIQAAILYRGNHVIGCSHIEPSKPAATVFCDYDCLNDDRGSYFCIRLKPVYSLKHDICSTKPEKVTN